MNKRGAHAFASDANNGEIHPSPKRSLSRSGILIILFVVLFILVLSIAGIVWWYFSGDKENPEVAHEIISVEIDPLSVRVYSYNGIVNVSFNLKKISGDEVDSLKFSISDGNFYNEEIVSTTANEIEKRIYSMNIGNLNASSLEIIYVIPIFDGKEGEKKITPFGKKYNIQIKEVKTVDIQNETPVKRRGHGGGGGGGGTPPTCTAKTCADFSSQCGSQISDGCGGILNCSTNCLEGFYCYSGEGDVKDICLNNSLKCFAPAISCSDSNSISQFYCHYNGTEFKIRNITGPCTNGCQNGACLGPCDLISASWNVTSAVEEELVQLNVNGNNCIGKELNYIIYKDILLWFDKKITTTSSDKYATWKAGLKSDGTKSTGKFYFKVFVVGNEDENIVSNNSLDVSEASKSSFRFISLSDTQTGASNLAILSRKIKFLNPSFIIFPGDLEENGFEQSAISEWKKSINGNSDNGLFDITFPTRGNHDTRVPSSMIAWQNYFDIRSVAQNVRAKNYNFMNRYEDIVYSFDYGNSHFVGLDTRGTTQKLSSEQIQWLDSDLTNAESRGLVHAFLYFHEPIYCGSGQYCAACTAKICAEDEASNELIQVINKHQIVTATFNGHEHFFASTYLDSSRIPILTHPFYQFTVATSNSESYLYDCSKNYRWDYCASAIGFTEVEVNDKNVNLNFYKMNENVPNKTITFTKGISNFLCAPNTNRCSGNLFQTCNADGTAWTLTDTCSANENCDAVLGCKAKLPKDCFELYSGHNADYANRYNLIFVGANYSDVNHLAKIANDILDYNHENQRGLLSIKPFDELKNNFNFWVVNDIGVGLLPWNDMKMLAYKKCGPILSNVLDDRIIVVALVNTQELINGGSFGRSGTYTPWGEDKTLFVYSDMVTTHVHELMHTIPLLVDEYSGSETSAPPLNSETLLSSQFYYKDYPATLSECLNNASWKNMIGDGCGKPGIVDCFDEQKYRNTGKFQCLTADRSCDLEIYCFEGGLYREKGIFRSVYNSFMNSPYNINTNNLGLGVWNERIIRNKIQNELNPNQEKCKDASECDDNLFCNGIETCDALTGCKSGTAPVCNDGVSCTTDSCNEQFDRCDYNTNSCKCSTNAQCNDNNPCTDDICTPQLICSHTNKAIGTTCDDGKFCTTNDKCNSGVCSGIPIITDDKIACTFDYCGEATDKIIHTPIDNDGDKYNICEGASKDCDDNNKNINRGATELCDGVDNNCDERIDEGCADIAVVNVNMLKQTKNNIQVSWELKSGQNEIHHYKVFANGLNVSTMYKTQTSYNFNLAGKNEGWYRFKIVAYDNKNKVIGSTTEEEIYAFFPRAPLVDNYNVKWEVGIPGVYYPDPNLHPEARSKIVNELEPHFCKSLSDTNCHGFSKGASSDSYRIISVESGEDKTHFSLYDTESGPLKQINFMYRYDGLKPIGNEKEWYKILINGFIDSAKIGEESDGDYYLRVSICPECYSSSIDQIKWVHRFAEAIEIGSNENPALKKYRWTLYSILEMSTNTLELDYKSGGWLVNDVGKQNYLISFGGEPYELNSRGNIIPKAEPEISLEKFMDTLRRLNYVSNFISDSKKFDVGAIDSSALNERIKNIISHGVLALGGKSSPQTLTISDFYNSGNGYGYYGWNIANNEPVGISRRTSFTKACGGYGGNWGGALSSTDIGQTKMMYILLYGNLPYDFPEKDWFAEKPKIKNGYGYKYCSGVSCVSSLEIIQEQLGKWITGCCERYKSDVSGEGSVNYCKTKFTPDILTPVCTPSTKQCSGNLFQTCNADGTAWILTDTCSANENCDDVLGCTAKILCTETSCDDNLFCNGIETCDALTGCKSGTAPVCNDGVSCTTDSCNEQFDRCDYNTASCKCSTNAQCNDNNPCTDDICTPQLICSHTNKAIGTTCDDGKFCTTNDKCNSGVCSGIPIITDDKIACTFDYCGEATDKIIHTPIDNDKDNYNICEGASKDCDDNNKNINRGATELCDGVDNNCDERIDEGCTCNQLKGFLCDTNAGEICSGTQLISSDSEKCCSTKCVLPSWNLCSDCGKGLFNFCDKKECDSIPGSACYFSTITREKCLSCKFVVCENYTSQSDCSADKCGINKCRWDSSSEKCVQRVYENAYVIKEASSDILHKFYYDLDADRVDRRLRATIFHEISYDRGKTWEKQNPHLLNDLTENWTARYDIRATSSKDGNIYLTYYLADCGRTSDASRAVVFKSSNHGKTWEGPYAVKNFEGTGVCSPKKISETKTIYPAGSGSGDDQIILSLEDKSILLFSLYLQNPNYPNPSESGVYFAPNMGLFSARSLDEGKTWTNQKVLIYNMSGLDKNLHKGIPHANDIIQEPSTKYIYLGSSSFGTSGNADPWVYVSKDNGETWNFNSPEIVGAHSPMNEGIFLFIYDGKVCGSVYQQNSSESRTYLYCRQSTGKWEKIKDFERIYRECNYTYPIKYFETKTLANGSVVKVERDWSKDKVCGAPAGNAIVFSDGKVGWFISRWDKNGDMRIQSEDITKYFLSSASGNILASPSSSGAENYEKNKEPLLSPSENSEILNSDKNSIEDEKQIEKDSGKLISFLVFVVLAFAFVFLIAIRKMTRLRRRGKKI